MGAPQAAEIVENRLWQRRQPLLVALADDAQHLVGPVNGADLQRGGLADAQTTRIHDGKARLVDRVADTAEEDDGPDLPTARQAAASAVARRSFFSPNSNQSRPSV